VASQHIDDEAELASDEVRHIDAGELWLGRTYPVAAAVAATLRVVAHIATETAGASPDTLTITHPAAWAAPRRAVLAEAAARAGLPAPRFVPEPVAAARFLSSLPGRPTGPLVVYDLGAGTFDVSVVQSKPDGLDVLAVDGIGDCGGLDLDSAVVSLIRNAVSAGDTARWERIVNPRTEQDRRHSAGGADRARDDPIQDQTRRG
jgi:molecular chaperone DnaK (HSP70)